MKGTIKYKTPPRSQDKVTVPKFLDYFYGFSKKDQAVIVSEINRATFRKRWLELDKSLPDLKFSDAEIMNQVKAVRNGAKTKNRS